MSTPPFTIDKEGIKKTLTVALWVAGSAAVTALLDFATQIDFGAYAPVAMGVINILGVLVKQYAFATKE
ncbi:hypothetical protein [Blastopirellula marina]|uniref:Holin n=1 Tax=Blastopirellula marina TaxID=124 RepID=A0A2S8GSG0_9BACT|nr:hypothetical protein [Blastopirellula marina]PQO47363.1 hypothetical protein C5Y93_04795 [Blastopirellula marina]